MATATKKKSAAAKPAGSATRKSAGSKPKLRVEVGGKTAAAASPATAPAPTVVAEEAPQPSRPVLRKKELIEQVVARSGIRKKMAKPAIEAALAVLGEALGEGRDMNLSPLGKLRINRAKTVGGGRVYITKIRRTDSSPTPPLAEPGEDG